MIIMAKEKKPRKKPTCNFLGWKIDGVLHKEPPEWVKEHIAAIFIEVLLDGPKASDSQKYRDDWEKKQSCGHKTKEAGDYNG